MGRAWVATAVVLAAATLAACGSSSSSSTTTSGPASATTTTYPASVAVFGDSLAAESQTYFTNLVKAADESVTTFYSSKGGSATCDWLGEMKTLASTHHLEAVELVFSGNAFTPCMGDVGYYNPAWLAKYRTYTLDAIDIWVPTGAHVYLIGTPITRNEQESVPNWDELNLLYAQLAAADPDHVSYVDAGAAVEGPNQTFAQTLPCLPVEPCTGPVVGGVHSNVVRSPDGVHFCPVQGDDHGACPVYASGAFRFANAMVEALATTS